MFKAPCDNKKCNSHNNSQSGCEVNGKFTIDLCNSYEPPFFRYIELVRIVAEAKGIMTAFTQFPHQGSPYNRLIDNTARAMRKWLDAEEKFFKITTGDYRG